MQECPLSTKSGAFVYVYACGVLRCAARDVRPPSARIWRRLSTAGLQVSVPTRVFNNCGRLGKAVTRLLCCAQLTDSFVITPIWKSVVVDVLKVTVKAVQTALHRPVEKERPFSVRFPLPVEKAHRVVDPVLSEHQ